MRRLADAGEIDGVANSKTLDRVIEMTVVDRSGEMRSRIIVERIVTAVSARSKVKNMVGRIGAREDACDTAKKCRDPVLGAGQRLNWSAFQRFWAWANGAQERTRTFTAVKPLAPEASASTNSATWARAG